MKLISKSKDAGSISTEPLIKTEKNFYLILSERHDEDAATAFFKTTIEANSIPEKVVIDKSGANFSGVRNFNILFLLSGFYHLIDILQVKYLNNIIEQDHRFIKKITGPMRGFKSFTSASATLDGIETAHMIRKGQFGTDIKSPFEQFAALAG